MRKSFLKFYLDEIKENRAYILAIISFLLLSYSVYLICDENTISQLGIEDGLFEYLTAIFFFISSVLFFLEFFSHKNIFILLLSILMFLAFGEEISWGQRIFGFSTPDIIDKINVQHEFNIHNLWFLNRWDSPLRHTIFDRIVSINFLYKLFWLVYGVLLPLCSMYNQSALSLLKKIRLPIPPLSIGVTFLLNWLTFRIMLSFILPPNKIFQYYDTIGEICECIAAFIFMILGSYFLKRKSQFYKVAASQL